MKQHIRLFATFLVLACSLFLTACGTTSGGSVSYSTGIYGSYGYPYYGYGRCCYGDIDIDIDRPDRPEHPNRPDRPNKPDRPSTQPVTLPASVTGRPSRSQMSRPARMPRGGGGRRR